MNRKVFIAKLLMIIWIARFCFMQLAYRYERAESRESFEKIKPHINSNKVENIVFENIAAIDWENDNEFELNGKIYDVINITESHSKISVKCISDEKEAEIIRSFQNIFQNSNDNKTENSHKINFENIKYITSEHPQFHFVHIIHSITNFYQKTFYLSQIKLVIQLPPENFV